LRLWLFYMHLQELIERHIRLWINQNIKEHIWEAEPALVNFICSKVLAGRAPQDILGSMQMVSYIWHSIPEYCGMCLKVSICSLMQILNDLSTKVRAFVYLLLPLEFPDNQFVYFILYNQNRPTVIIIVTASVVLWATCTVECCLPRMSGTWPVLD
jgi:hypothetical protein